jgi:hypothetical protein
MGYGVASTPALVVNGELKPPAVPRPSNQGSPHDPEHGPQAVSGDQLLWGS